MKKTVLALLILAIVFTTGCGRSTETSLTGSNAQTEAGTWQLDNTDSGASSIKDSGEQDGEDAGQNNTGADTAAAGGEQSKTEDQASEAVLDRIPAEVRDYLADNAQKLVTEYQPDAPGLPEPIKISDTCSIIDYTAGNLDSDGYDELAAVVENSGETRPDTGSPARWLLILSKRGHDQYSVVDYNPCFILGAEEGGVYGDPYSGISINDRILSVVHYGGSNYRWGYIHEFAYKGDRLKLIRFTETDEFTGTGNGTKTVYDFNSSSLKQYAEYREGSSEKLIYESAISGYDCVFENFRIVDLKDQSFTARYLPDLGAYDYYNGTVIRTGTSPDEVLDKIRNSQFKDFQKAEFSWTEETLKNYGSVCFFEPAGYYYEKDDTVLYYWKAEADDSGNVKHIVLLNSIGSEGEPKFDFYYYNDKTGEISKM